MKEEETPNFAAEGRRSGSRRRGRRRVECEFVRMCRRTERGSRDASERLSSAQPATPANTTHAGKTDETRTHSKARAECMCVCFVAVLRKTPASRLVVGFVSWTEKTADQMRGKSREKGEANERRRERKGCAIKKLIKEVPSFPAEKRKSDRRQGVSQG